MAQASSLCCQWASSPLIPSNKPSQPKAAPPPPLPALSHLAALLHTLASLVLLAYGLNCYLMLTWHFSSRQRQARRLAELEATHAQKAATIPAPLPPTITTQIPIYNELNVAARVIRAVAAMDYPPEQHQILILDDSTDETAALIDHLAVELRATGTWIEVCRRPTRTGYKAGALADSMPRVAGEYIAIFDADFVPASDFLCRMLPFLGQPGVGLVQARWDHLNSCQSLLTRTQAAGIDAHFVIEQSARAARGLFLNFNGTAGIWTRRAINEAGGWTADTLTEDLDLSYRAQLAGWRFEYIPHLTVPAELPATCSGFRSQQFRWAKGSVQTLLKLLPRVLRSPTVSPLQKIQAVFHLGNYLVYPAMLVASLLMLPVLPSQAALWRTPGIWLPGLALALGAIGPSLLTLAAQWSLHPQHRLRAVLLLPVMMCISLGISLSNTRAVLQALQRVPSGFIRTPKSGSASTKTYRTRCGWLPYAEITAGLYLLFTSWIFLSRGLPAGLPFLLLQAIGFHLIGWTSLREAHPARP